MSVTVEPGPRSAPHKLPHTRGGFGVWAVSTVILRAGTTMVYPTL